MPSLFHDVKSVVNLRKGVVFVKIQIGCLSRQIFVFV